jgi:hypothetical protein
MKARVADMYKEARRYSLARGVARRNPKEMT